MGVRTVFVAVLLFVPAGAAASDWVRIDTPNFVVYGESGEKHTREVAGEFERFREALGRVIPRAAMRAPVPTVVVVFETLQSFEPYRPMFNGRRVQLAGYFRSAEHENVVALAVEDRATALRVVFHEYAHLAIANDMAVTPAWLGEGLAEYYSTFDLSPDGRQAVLGAVIPEHVRLLNQAKLLPLEQLLSVTRESPMYYEGKRRTLFYAQSWALVHYLVSEEPSRADALARYARVTGAGQDPVAAWNEIFGDIDAAVAIKRYLGRQEVRGVLYKFAAGIDKAAGVAASVPPSEMEAVFGDLLQWTPAVSLEAEARLEKAAAMQPPSGRARALLGLARAGQDKPEEGRAALLSAASDPDWLTQYYVATGLARLLPSSSPDGRAALAAAATRALDAVLAARPETPHALVLRAQVAVSSDGDLSGALLNARRARALAPGRDDYGFLEAKILARQGSFAEARHVLGPLMSPLARTETREQARTTMRYVLGLERQAAQKPLRDLASLSDAPQPASDAAVAPAREPVYRLMKPGEQRTEGLLERIDCGVRVVTMHVRADGRLLRFTAGRLEEVEFISYRDDRTGSIPCGPRRPPERVYVTWRPARAAGTAALGRAVAVEFLVKQAEGGVGFLNSRR